jgi:hypothetical protein
MARKPAPKRNQKKNRRAKRRQVSSIPRQIQNSQYIPKNRLVKFTDYRSYIVTDNATTGVYALPPVLQIALNNPLKFIESSQGTWSANNVGAKGPAVPGISKWVTNKSPGTTSTADYLTASCLGSKITITAVPMPSGHSDDAEDAYQDVIKCFLANQTRTGYLKNKSITDTFNVEMMSELPQVRSANTYYNAGSVPKGCTLSLSYSFKKNNPHVGKQAENLFYADTGPTETDIAAFVMMPGDSGGYGSTGARLPKMRVEIRVSYIVLLGEVNTHQNQGINQGNNLSDIAQVAMDRIDRKIANLA